MSGPPASWGPGPPPWQPPPWQPPPWQPQPQPWQSPPWQSPPAWGPPPPVVPARYDGPPGPDGGPRGRWTWVVVSVVAALVLVAGVVVALLLAGGGSQPEATGAPAPAPAAASAQPLLFGAGKRPVQLDSIPATVRLDPALTWDRAVIDGPDGAAATTALRFVQAVRARDWTTAYGLCAAEVRQAAAAPARLLATTPPTVVGAAFYGDELRGQGVVGGGLIAVESYPSEYLVTFRLQLADASPATVTLWLGHDVTVRDWT